MCFPSYIFDGKVFSISQFYLINMPNITKFHQVPPSSENFYACGSWAEVLLGVLL